MIKLPEVYNSRELEDILNDPRSLIDIVDAVEIQHKRDCKELLEQFLDILKEHAGNYPVGKVIESREYYCSYWLPDSLVKDLRDLLKKVKEECYDRTNSKTTL